jgi:hypothetical protein
MSGAWKRIAGVSAAPAAWAIVTQLGQVLPYTDCGNRLSSSLIAACAGGIVAVVSAAVSFQSMTEASDEGSRFVSLLSGGIASAFAFALVLQALAATLLDPCQR